MLVFVTTLGELPGLILSGFLVDKFGRRYVQTAFLAAAALCMAGMMFNPSPWVAIFLLLGGRMFVNGSWAALWAYTPEVRCDIPYLQT
jgi:MFS family permease